MQTEFDLIIIGAGCAGLSLGTRLASLDSQAPKTLLLESRVAYDNDRTWCFWGDAHTPFATLARHSWQRLSQRGQSSHVDRLRPNTLPDVVRSRFLCSGC